MIGKRIVVLEQTNPKASSGKEMCGMVKIVLSGNAVQMSLFVSGLNLRFADEWWLLSAFGSQCFAQKLTSPISETFSAQACGIEAVACLLVGVKSGAATEVACGYVTDKNLVSVLRRKTDELIFGKTEPTEYERFAENTENFYGGSEAEKLKKAANARYKCVEDYSAAFERYYATNAGNDYYQSVKSHVCKIFTQFPPYYPLIDKYTDSFFVKIDFPSSDKYFVMGVLCNGGEVKYICYGLPSDKSDISDKDFSYVTAKDVSFWMLFQDASNGQITVLK